MLPHGFGIATQFHKKYKFSEFPLGNSNPCDSMGF